MKHNSEATLLIKLFFKYVKIQTNACIKAIRSDNAKESQLTEFLQT